MLGNLIKSDPRQGFVLEDGAVLRIKNVELLLVGVVVVCAVLDRQLPVLGGFLVGLQHGDLVDAAEGARPVHPGLDHLLVHLQGVLLVLIQVAELPFKFPHHEHLLGVGLDGEGVPGVILEVGADVLAETERWQFASVVVFAVGGCNLTSLESILVLFNEIRRSVRHL